MNIINILSLLSLLLLFPKMKISKKNEFHPQPFPLEITKGLAGYFTVCVLLHHIINVLLMTNKFPNNSFLLEHAGVLLVGYFFFFSGYGLIVSYEEKNQYLKTFLFRRVCTVLLPYFLCNYAYMTATLLMGNHFTMKQLLLAFFGVILLNDHMWFAVEIMILYLAFYFIFRFLRKEKVKYIAMAMVILCMITVSFLLGHNMYSMVQMNWFQGEWWYNTTLLFFLGMLFAKFRAKIIPFIQRHYKKFLAVTTLLFLLLWNATEYMLCNHGYWTETISSKGYADKLMTFSVQLPMVVAFELLLLLVLMKIQPHNKCLQFLGKISLEMILLQNVFLLCFDKYISANFYLYLVLTFTGTVIFATIINKIKLLILERKE